MRFKYFTSFILVCIYSAQTHAQFSWDGALELEQRYFLESDQLNNISNGQTSARLQLEFFTNWNDGDDQLIFEPFVRLDNQDDERSHADIRQLLWTHYSNDWELSAGIGKVFWGVTETQHLVDIINQTDFVENIDGEDKLGQPMVRFQYHSDFGTFDTYLLPFFRTRTYAGQDSRLTGGIIASNDQEFYESADEDSHIDYAFRYSNTLGSWGLGFSVFDGTSREADLLQFLDTASLTLPLNTTPFYPQITQYGADIQITTAAWLIKLEAIRRNFDNALFEDFSAATTGVEYTFVGVFGSAYDIGALAEYSWDERKENATSPFQNDLFIGARLALNDISGSEVLFGFTNDFDDSSSRSAFIEGSTRITSAFTANIEVRYFDADNPQDLLFNFRDSSFVQLGFEYFFN